MLDRRSNRRQWVANLVGRAGSHLSRGGQPLGPIEPLEAVALLTYECGVLEGEGGLTGKHAEQLPLAGVEPERRATAGRPDGQEPSQLIQCDERETGRGAQRAERVALTGVEEVDDTGLFRQHERHLVDLEPAGQPAVGGEGRGVGNRRLYAAGRGDAEWCAVALAQEDRHALEAEELA